MRSIRVLVAEDHALMRDAVRMILEDVAELEIVGEATRGTEVVPLVGRLEPHVVLLDLGLPGMDGFACLEQLREHHPTVKVVVFTAHDDPKQIEAALRRGADSYVVKSINPEDLPSAIRQAVEGSVFHPYALADGAGDELRRTGLSEKEVAVLRQLAHGRSNKEIASALFVSEQTVKFHLRNVYKKLGVQSRTEALRHAYDLDLVETT